MLSEKEVDEEPSSAKTETTNATTVTSTAPSGTVSPSSHPHTPWDEYNGIHFTPRRAMASFENLVAMANHQERLKEARSLIWRDKGQPVVELDTLEQCLKHALAGGLRE